MAVKATKRGTKKTATAAIGGGVLTGAAGLGASLLNAPANIAKGIAGTAVPRSRPVVKKPKGNVAKPFDSNAFGRTLKDLTDASSKLGQTVIQGAQPPTTPFDGLAALLGGAGGFDPNNVQVDTSAYDQQEKTARTNGADADAKLNAMYRQLAQSYLDDNAGTKAAYAQTRADQAASADQAANDVKQSYKSSNADLMSTLSRLGIGDAAGVIANKGTSLQGDQAATLSGIAANKGAALNATDANSQAAQEYNRNISSAAKLEGTTQRASNQQNLSKVLQTIAMARTNAVNQAKQAAQQAAASAQGDQFSNALALAQAQQSYLNDQSDRQSAAAQAQAKQDSSDFSAAQGLNKQQTSKSSAVASAIAGFMRQGMSYEDALKRAQALFGN